MVRSGFDLLLLTLILAIGSISLLIIFSINQSLAFNQLVFWAIGLAVLWFFSFFDFREWQKLSTIFYLFALAALTLLIFIGDPVRGSVRWIDLGFFRFQPSEVAKVATILTLASFFSEKSSSEIKNLVISFLIILPSFILVFRQPDIGNALTFVAIWLGMIIVSGIRPKALVLGFLSTIVFIALIYNLLAPYQKERLSTFTNPVSDPLGTGYQIIQSKIAVGSGQFFGRGLGRSSQSQLKFLPEAESDFIFASVAEQLGFVGAGLLLVLYTLFLVKVLSFARSGNRFSQLLVIGTISFFLFQLLVNVGMNMGLVPVTGITFPLVSYGGSSLISTLFLLGIVFSTRRQNLNQDV